MNDLESKLRELPWAEPSPGLDDRVMAGKPVPSLSREPWKVPLWLTAAIALAMTVVGFVSGFAWRNRQLPAERPPRLATTVQVICDSRSSGDPFDFTRISDWFGTAELHATVTIEKGAER